MFSPFFSILLCSFVPANLPSRTSVLSNWDVGVLKTPFPCFFSRFVPTFSRGFLCVFPHFPMSIVAVFQGIRTRGGLVPPANVQMPPPTLQDLFLLEAPELNILPDTERVEMPGVTTKIVTDSREFMKLFYYGEQHRMTRATLMNPTSSRGHAALICNVKMQPIDPSMSMKIGKLVLVDLAGYERFAATGITTGIAAEEAKKINASLLALGGVVNSLADRQNHIPYRNSKLTRLLRDCLGGTSKSTIVLTIGPCDKYKQETAGTLYFGFRAMAVKVDTRSIPCPLLHFPLCFAFAPFLN